MAIPGPFDNVFFSITLYCTLHDNYIRFVFVCLFRFGDLSYIAHSLCDCLKKWKFNGLIVESIVELFMLFEGDDK